MALPFYITFIDPPATHPDISPRGYAVIEAVGIWDAADTADRLFAGEYHLIFGTPYWERYTPHYPDGEQLRVTTGRGMVEQLREEPPSPAVPRGRQLHAAAEPGLPGNVQALSLTSSQEPGYVQETPATPATEGGNMGHTSNLGIMDYKSMSAQIADLQRRQNGKIISWTGRLAVAGDGGPDWMEFSVLGRPAETMILRLDGQGITLLPQPAPAANSRMANP